MKSVEKLVYNVQRRKQFFAGVFLSLLVEGMNQSSHEVRAVNSLLTQYAGNYGAHDVHHNELVCQYEENRTGSVSKQLIYKCCLILIKPLKE